MTTRTSMTMQVSTPGGYRATHTVKRIIAEAEDGSFCLKPKHRDLATALVPGILEYSLSTDAIGFMAIDRGLLTKVDEEVVIWVRHAVASDQLDRLKEVVDVEFAELEDRERASRSAVSRLEADFARRFLKIRESSHV